MITAKNFIKAFFPARVHLMRIFIAYVNFVWMLFEFSDIICSMSALENSISCLIFVDVPEGDVVEG
jgi:hypothetical protein